MLAELLAFEAWQRHLQEVAYEDQRWRDLVDRATNENAARDFNLSLGVPVCCQLAQKLALNALYEGNGSGARSNTVNHIQIMEPLMAGRINCGAHDLLCGAKPGRKGLSTTGPHWHDENSGLFDRVTFQVVSASPSGSAVQFRSSSA